MRDIQKAEDSQIAAIVAVIAHARPDILVLTNFDYDFDGLALAAFTQILSEAGVTFAHRYAAEPNSGAMTELDLDGDGRSGTPRDAQGYGRFRGDSGLAILSRWPVGQVTDYSALLWRDLPGATRPEGTKDGVWDVQRLSSTAHWVAPIETPDGEIELMIWSATPTVFDGPEDRNGLRNRDEARLWKLILDGQFGAVPEAPIVIGNANLDPFDGEGRREAITDLLEHPQLQDPQPRGEGGARAQTPDHSGDPGLDTVDWREPTPGNLRVSYILPSVQWRVIDSGVVWPAPEDPLADLLGDDGLAAGPHRLVWVDLLR